ncbi:GntR family transcriptional regulator [Lacrimispora sphenoides]|uniref:GntR family transcriptional regulator n=1 Tax=Lacrimispora sphenoides JCM 1415 TaxID=1297793 RepID=A0ABY1C6S7_9FIRM|nr:GntR family transcriptional regulator [Lacrimispora sphenoides]SET75033.1 GntR family transcriptional regulator [[Clostridium] sphenoides JCM 1415]SUY50981.1 GntR family transcriptional regulator [Lacrimispora sphenoides]
MLNHEKGAQPLYSQLETILKKQIEHGEFNKGDIFPTEKMLMEEYNVSRVTIRQALAALTLDRYIKSSRGIGTTVIYEKIDEHLKSVISFTDEMKQHNITMSTSYCTMEKVRPGKKVAMVLGIPETKQCYCLTRVRCVDKIPMVYSVTYLKEIVELPMEKEYYMESLYKYLQETHGIIIVRGQDTLEAVLSTKEIQDFLKVDPQLPLFKRIRKTFLADGEIFEYSDCYYPGNRYKYSVDL